MVPHDARARRRRPSGAGRSDPRNPAPTSPTGRQFRSSPLNDDGSGVGGNTGCCRAAKGQPPRTPSSRQRGTAGTPGEHPTPHPRGVEVGVAPHWNPSRIKRTLSPAFPGNSNCCTLIGMQRETAGRGGRVGKRTIEPYLLHYTRPETGSGRPRLSTLSPLGSDARPPGTTTPGPRPPPPHTPQPHSHLPSDRPHRHRCNRRPCKRRVVVADPVHRGPRDDVPYTCSRVGHYSSVVDLLVPDEIGRRVQFAVPVDAPLHTVSHTTWAAPVLSPGSRWVWLHSAVLRSRSVAASFTQRRGHRGSSAATATGRRDRRGAGGPDRLAPSRGAATGWAPSRTGRRGRAQAAARRRRQ